MYFKTWLFGQDHHLIKSFAMRFCGAYSRNNLEICVQKIINLIWGVHNDMFGVMHYYTPFSTVSIMDISDDSFNYLDLELVEFLAGLRNNREEINENRKFEIKTILCVKPEESEVEEDCNICYEKTKNCNMVTLNCQHNFCGNCVSQTLKKCNKIKFPNCAMCRTKIENVIVKDEEVLNILKENIF